MTGIGSAVAGEKSLGEKDGQLRGEKNLGGRGLGEASSVEPPSPRRRARARGPRLVATFSSTRAALACEAACHEAGVAGRLVPVPVSVAADCGLAWALPPEECAAFEGLLCARALAFESFWELGAGTARRLARGEES